MHYLVTDLGGITRGRGAWESAGGELQSSMGWVPVNQYISPLDTIAPSPFGSRGDCRLYPDADTLVDVTLESGRRLRFALCEIAGLQRESIGLCSRQFLKAALARLEALGLKLFAAFEQECWVDSPTVPHDSPGFSFQRFLRHEPFGSKLMNAFEQAGLKPETLLAEFAPRQFEFTFAPVFGVAAADQAVVSREIARAVGWDMNTNVSFSPARAPGGVCSGTHVHFSLWTLDGKPALYDPAGPGRLTAAGAAFAAGIVRHMKALCAFTAPTPVSYERLQPHRWSSAYTCIGEQDREATLRICPIVGGRAPDKQFNLEFRAADATANPYLLLGALVCAGLDGLEESLALPQLMDCDPAELTDAERARAGIERLPESLPAALAALRADAKAMAWLPAPLREAYLQMKSAEIEACAGLDMQAICDRYAAIY
jgi:glutamine synthetase